MKKLAKKIVYTGLLSLLVIAVNKLIFVIATMKDQLSQPNAYHYQWKFGKIFYTVAGEGKPVLLIHSTLPGTSSFEFHKLIKRMSKEYKVYAIDLLGYGLSDKPKMTYTAYLFVQLIADFAKDVIGEPVTLITSGKSNAYATMACNQYSYLFNRLVFINPTPIFQLKRNPRNIDKLLKFILESPMLGTTVYNFLHSYKVIEHTFYRKYIKNGLKVRKKYVRAFHEASHTGQSSVKFLYASELCQYTNVNIIDAIEQIDNSIYIIQGIYRDEDFEMAAKTYRDLNPSIETASIDDAKVFPHLEKTDDTYELISIFLHE